MPDCDRCLGKAMRIADVLDKLDANTLNGLAQSRGCAVDELSMKLQGDWVALVGFLSARKIADALYKTMDETDLRVLAIRAFQDAGSTQVPFTPNDDGWSQPLTVRRIMKNIAGWDAAPTALSTPAWTTVVRKLRGLGLEVQDPKKPNQGIRRGNQGNKPEIGGKIRIRRFFAAG